MEPVKFYDIIDNGANAAEVSFVEGIKPVIGDFYQGDLLRMFAKYNVGKGNSEILSFRFIPATAIDKDDKLVDLIALEQAYFREGRPAARLAEFFDTITTLRTQKFRKRVYPRATTIESEEINEDEARLLGGANGVAAGVAQIAGSDAFVRAVAASEQLYHNRKFVDALHNLVDNGITYVKTRWDGAPNEEGDGNDITVPLPLYCQYETQNEGYIGVSDLVKIEAQMLNNMTDANNLYRRVKTMLVSPNTAAEMLLHASDAMDILHKAFYGSMGRPNPNGGGNAAYPNVAQLPDAYGFQFYTHPYIQDNEAFVITPGVTMEVFDWGTTTKAKEDPNIWTTSTIRRRLKFGVEVAQPLSFLHVKIKGKTAAYDGDRMDNLTTSTDEPLKPIRKTVKAGG